MDEKPSSADLQWQKNLEHMAAYELRGALEEVVKNGQQWRFDVLLSHPDMAENIFDGGLFAAAESGRLGMFKALLEKGAAFDKETDGPNLLSAAAQYGQLVITNYLIDEMKVDFHDGDESALISAARHGKLDVVENLLSRGANIYAQDGEALVAAAEEGHLAVIKYLIDAGLHVDVQDGAPLRRSILMEKDNSVAFLLENGANPNLQDRWGGGIPLADAIAQNDVKLVKLLLKHGADPRQLGAYQVRRHENRQIFKMLLAWEKEQRANATKAKLAEFKDTFPAAYSFDDLRSKKGPSGDTGLLLAAKSGEFDTLVLKASGGDPSHLTAQDLSHPADAEETVATLLAAQKKLQQFFHADLWLSHQAEMMKAYDSLSKVQKTRVNLGPALAAVRQKSLQNKAGGGVRFKPPKP